MISRKLISNIEVLDLHNEWLRVSLVPALGGKLLSVYNNELSKEFIWTNTGMPLQVHPPGSNYDSGFIGGIDELIPNDIPQSIDSIDYPDHGELWTTPLDHAISGGTVTMSAILPLSGIKYSKSVSLDNNGPVIILDYKITNQTKETRHFLWKLHAAANIEPGDRMLSGAAYGQVADLDYSRFGHTNEFSWPIIEEADASVIPENDRSVDFFYLYGSPGGHMHLSGNNKEHLFGYEYDQSIFPYQWYFASYGGFQDHYVAILEPCTAMPIDINTAIQKNQCTVLKAGETLTTRVKIFAGPSNRYQQEL
jgi:hypothetical protein